MQVVGFFVIFLTIILERIFDIYTQNFEVGVIIKIQNFFVGDKGFESLWWAGNHWFNQTSIYWLLLTHFYVTMFFAYNALVTIKIFYVGNLYMAFIILLEIIYQAP